MNGCKFTYNFGQSLPDGKRTIGTFNIGPSGCTPISLQIEACTITIGAQEGIKAKYESTGKETEAAFNVHVETSHLKYTQSGWCGSSGSGTFEDGEYSGSWRVQGPKSNGIRLKNIDPSGFYAEEYPATITGAQDKEGTHVFGIESGLSMKCSSATFATTLTASSTTATIAPAYSGCELAGTGIGITVTMNGCTYRVHSDSDAVDIVCPVGKSIEAASLTCKVLVPSQVGLKTVQGELTLNSGLYSANVNSSISGIAYSKTKDGFLCPLSGTGEMKDGTYSGETPVGGTNPSGEAISIWAS